ncbi:NAD(P)-binding domain-containing protein [Halomonas alkalisoli]|uniref:NAD(P)-binding domain-containing protein n=1 Tax=Halomonas alkalisoli TaxID=2907158 RepID=UPI001F1A8893|nr:NAD(P)-binding domain-containing protein [Halomonas alkalisoli]MCE9681684.1 NAD(P)-binding domain-containing protein [Halomonas alkalisoli]
MRIGLIGLGEVGRCLAEGLLLAGIRVDGIDAALNAQASTSLAARGLTIQPTMGHWIRELDAVMVCVNGGAANDVNRQLATHLKAGQVVFDLTTASPQQKRHSAELVEARGAAFLDVAIMGSIAMKGFATSMLVAGDVQQSESACVLRVLQDSGMTLRSMASSSVGDAICLKLIRSVYTKGAEALAVKCIVTAEHFGVRDLLYEVLADLDDIPIKRFMNTLVRTHVLHAERRMKEVGEAQQLLTEAGVSTQLLDSVKEVFAETLSIEQCWEGDELPSIEQAIAQLGQATKPHGTVEQ